MSNPATISADSSSRARSSGAVQQAIAQAARSSGTDFGFLLAQAKVESGLDPHAKARTSSATGLFQFIDSTWLRLAERHGPSVGIGSQFDLSDPATRREVLALRNNPQIASHMAAALAQENSDILSPMLGRAPDAGELYLAHFLGSGEASRFLKALDANPQAPAAPLFAKQAAANRAIFFDGSGSSRTLAEVMGLLRGKIEAAMPDGGPADSYRLAPVAARAPASAPPLPQWKMQSQLPLSRVIESQFALADGTSGNAFAGDHARRAYARLKAFGL